MDVSNLPSAGTSDYRVEIEPTVQNGWVLVGMTGQVYLEVGARRQAISVPTEAVRGDTTSPFVEVLIDGVVEKRPIVAGLVTVERTEVLSGLSVGESVVVATEDPEQ